MARRSHSCSLYALALALLLVLVSGQSPSPASSPSSSASPSPSPQTFVVDVGKGDHTFKPEVIQANVGDIVEFHFFPPNHSVVRAEYGYPCIPYELTGKGKVGFFSGFHPVDAIYPDPPKWQVRINDTDPIFYYCSAPGSCITYGMVGVINPNASVSLKSQQEKAKQAKYMLNPGESFPDEQSSSSAGYAASSTSKPSSAASTTAASATSAAASAGGSHGLGAGAIAGIAIGGAAVLVLAAALFFFMGRTKKLEDTLQRNSMAFGATHQGGGAPFNPSYGMYQRDSGSLVVPGGNNRVSQLTASTYDTTPMHKPPETIVETVSPRSAQGSPAPMQQPVADMSGVYFSGPTEPNASTPHQPSTGLHEMYTPAADEKLPPQVHDSHPVANHAQQQGNTLIPQQPTAERHG